MKTIKKVPVEVVYTEFLPIKAKMEFGKIYVTIEYMASSHLCLCGCGVECYLPFNKNGWQYLIDKPEKITITPSILQRFDCKSHYIITKGIANFV